MATTRGKRANAEAHHFGKERGQIEAGEANEFVQPRQTSGTAASMKQKGGHEHRKKRPMSSHASQNSSKCAPHTPDARFVGALTLFDQNHDHRAEINGDDLGDFAQELGEACICLLSNVCRVMACDRKQTGGGHVNVEDNGKRKTQM
jgi:hypothetical protein